VKGVAAARGVGPVLSGGACGWKQEKEMAGAID
jgi:hypothetical protein